MVHKYATDEQLEQIAYDFLTCKIGLEALSANLEQLDTSAMTDVNIILHQIRRIEDDFILMQSGVRRTFRIVNNGNMTINLK